MVYLWRGEPVGIPDAGPLVTVLTPVYNGAAHLEECIQSVLTQTYTNFEYIIVNNFSSDGSGDIAERYALLDKRIKVYHNAMLLDVIASHNRAFRLISNQSKYVKVVSGDDTIYPVCLERMVRVFEENPSVGVVGSAQLSGGQNKFKIKWAQRPTPYEQRVVTPGRELCRAHYFGANFVFGSPTSLMYRADLVRQEERFYPNSSSEADTSACCRCLSSTDYGFVHEVLSFERVHDGRVSSRSESLNAYLSSEIRDLTTYGPNALTPVELDRRIRDVLDTYYQYLAIQFLKHRDKTFWSYHRKVMADIGYPLRVVRLTKAVIKLASGAIRRPSLIRKLPFLSKNET